MADNYRRFSVAIRLQGKLAAAWVTDTMRARRRQRQQLVDGGFHEAADEIGVDFEWEIDSEGSLNLTDEAGEGNVRHVAEFARELMKLGYVLEPVAIYWSDASSRTRSGEFCGGAAIATKKRIEWLVLPEIVERKLRVIERRSARGVKK